MAREEEKTKKEREKKRREKRRKENHIDNNNKKCIHMWYEFVIVGTLVADIRIQYLPVHGRWSPYGWHQNPEPT